MTKNVLFYARYSTERQNEVSIETQVELGREFNDKKGWKLVEIFTDHAVSGTSYKTRPGIQALLARAAKADIDVVLCITVDRISRDSEHGNGFLKRLKFQDIELWTVHGNAVVTDMEMGLRATLSQELVEQIRYRTREGMKTAVRKGKHTTCVAYGHKVKLAYDGNGDRIAGLREIDPVEADVIRWIFKQYVQGVSPRDIAKVLNDKGMPGPRGAKWQATTIRGHVTRGTGILNNETYIGRVIWNRRNYRKNPETERRVARNNNAEDWVVGDCADLRIVDDALWARVKERQIEVGELFSHTTTNRLNASHRPTYLLSGMLQCAECGGPYAISGVGRYSCTYHKNRLPIDELGGACCSNSKTILRRNLEDRVLSCLMPAFFSTGIFDQVSTSVSKKVAAKLKAEPSKKATLAQELKTLDRDQKNLIKQISDRANEGRPRLAAFDDELDQLEVRRTRLAAELFEADVPADDMPQRLASLQDKFSPESIEIVMNALLFQARNEDDVSRQRFMPIIRDFIQTVVIGKTPGHQPATLEVHGHIASVMAAMDAVTALEKQFQAQKHSDYLDKLAAGELDTEQKQKKLLDGYVEELSIRRLAWANLQVCLVAGAGFEPAAFRL